MWFRSMLSSVLMTCMFSSGARAGGKMLPPDVARASNEFGWTLFEQLQMPQERTRNMLVSPLSAWLALTLASNGAEKETLQEMQTVLRTNQHSLVQTNPMARELLRTLLSNTGGTEVLRIANAVWANSDNFNLAEKFQTDAQTFYSILPDEHVVNSESFRDADTVDHINAWVSRSTGGMIPSIIRDLDPDMVSILVNALYVQGQWLFPFVKDLSGSADFHLADGSSKAVRMMQQHNSVLDFASSGRYMMITLPFRHGGGENAESLAEGRFTLDVVVPEKADGSIFDFKQEDYELLLPALSQETIQAAIPKFKFSFEISLTRALKAIGMQRAFQPNHAQLGPLGTSIAGARPYIGNVLQKTAVEMDENGFKAAAVTAVIVGNTSEPTEFKRFVADRPFFIALRDRNTGTLLFQGIIADPAAQ